MYILWGCLFWGAFIFMLVCLRTGSPLQKTPVDVHGKNGVILAIVLAATILACILPMGLSPYWNGEDAGARNQYEVMAESLLHGHIYMDYDDVDPRLMEMRSPYVPPLRDRLGINYHWDHAFYNGRYYMYFGIVPVLLLFLPYRVITGTSLTTYHATQLFAALFICGVFATFYELAKRFFKRMPFGLYLALSAAFSLMATWYSSAAPAMYCTAICSAFALGIWSLYLFIRAVWVETREGRRIALAFGGSLLGALEFGCRPPVALANFAVLPMLIEYLRGRKFSWKLVGQLALAASPYVVVGVALMIYNYVRFDSPFEFGQSYQLTITDQSQYGNIFFQLQYFKLREFLNNFFYVGTIRDVFPYINHNGALVNFPIIIAAGLGLFWKKARTALRRERLWGLVIALAAVPMIITVMDMLWSPYLMERYRSDFYWVLGLLAFILIGVCHDEMSEKSGIRYVRWMSVFAVFTIFCCFILWCVPYDGNYTEYMTEAPDMIRRALCFGLG